MPFFRFATIPILAAYALLAVSIGVRAQTIVTHGDCSPVIVEVMGDVSIVCNDESSEPKFRIAYYRIGGLGLSFLLDGLLSPEWEERLGGQHAIISNVVSDEARAFLDQFATPMRGSYLVGDVSFEGGEYGGQFADYARDVDPSIETVPGEAGDIPVLEPDRWRAYFGNGRRNGLFIPDIKAAAELFRGQNWPSGYRVIYSVLGMRGARLEDDRLIDGFTLWRWMSPADLATFEQAYREYVALVVREAFPTPGAGTPIDYGSAVEEILGSARTQQLARDLDSIRYLTRAGMPDRFMLVRGQSGVHYGWTFMSTPRDFQLLVAVLDNISDGAIEIGDFTLRETNAMTVRHHEDSNQALERAPQFSRRLFPLGALRPGEKIILPIRIELAQSEVNSDMQAELTAAAREGARIEQAIHAAGGATIEVQDSNRITLFRRAASSFPPQTVPEIVERFEYGPAWRIESVVVDNAEFTFRQHDPNNFVLIAGFGVGSCPYAFTYQPERRFWRSEGHFLFGADTPQEKRMEEKPLEHFHGRIMIREMEHEIAVLDMIRLKLVDERGKVSIHGPRRPALRKVDGDELTLSYGQEIELDFGIGADDWRGKRASLIASGYYVPFDSSRLLSNLEPN